MREYAHELLSDGGELELTRERHFRHFSTLADIKREEWPSQHYLGLTRGPRGPMAAVDALADDYENVRVALEWAAAADPCAARRLLIGTQDLFFMLGVGAGSRLVHLLLERCEKRDRDRAELLLSAGAFGLMAGDPEAGRAALVEARELSAEIGATTQHAWALMFSGLIETLGMNVELGREHLEACRTLSRELGLRICEARSTAVLGLNHVIAGDPGRGGGACDQRRRGR